MIDKKYIIAQKWSKWREFKDYFYVEGSIIYGATHVFPQIYNYVRLNNSKNYTIVTEGGDWCLKYINNQIISVDRTNSNSGYVHDIPSNINKIYSTNADTPKDIVECLPIGVLHTEELSNTKEKTNLIYCNFNPHNNPQYRNSLFQWCKNQPWILSDFPNRNNKTPEQDRALHSTYWNNLQISKYTISPYGNGIDCYRVWEALYCNCIPIVLDNLLYSQFDDLPIIRVKDFTHINHIELESNYNILIQKNNDKIYKDYWIKKINE